MWTSCLDCGLPLTDPESQARGRGQRCADKRAGVKHVVRVASTRRQLHHKLAEDQVLTGFPTIPTVQKGHRS